MTTAMLQAGLRIDRYELLSCIAEGGMGQVWRARLSGQHGFQRLYALKAIAPRYSQQATFRAMFLDETRLAALLDHPNVAQVFDFGEHDGVLYLIMEYVDGPSLRALRQRAIEVGRPLPLPVILRIAADLCAGVHAVHEVRDEGGNLLELVHRDVSPDNILVGRNGAVKLTDFGIVKAANRLSSETQGGAMKGKARYASPEQAIGSRVDRRSDVFSVGATLFELLANEVPFEAPCDLAVLTRLTGGDAPNPLPSTVPESLRDLVFRCLARRPADRVPNADIVRRELEELIRGGLYADGATVGELVQSLFRQATGRESGSEVPRVTPVSPASDHVMAVEEPSAPPPRPQRRRMPWIAFAAGGVFGAASIALLASQPTTTVDTPSAIPSRSLPSSPPDPQTTTIPAHGLPEGFTPIASAMSPPIHSESPQSQQQVPPSRHLTLPEQSPMPSSAALGTNATPRILEHSLPGASRALPSSSKRAATAPTPRVLQPKTNAAGLDATPNGRVRPGASTTWMDGVLDGYK